MDEPHTDHALRDRLQRLVGVMPAPEVADPLPAIQGRLRRRRQRRVGARLGALAAVALLVVTVVALDRRGDDPSGLDVVGPPAVVDAPPPLEPSPVRLWLSASRVPPGDHDLVAILVNDRDDGTTFGVGAAVDRWDGEQWVPHRNLTMCLDGWACVGEVIELHASPVRQAIGLTARPDRAGPPQRFNIAGLDAGWYRVRQTANSGTVAAAILHITNDASVQPSLRPLDRPAISVSPALLTPRGGEVQLTPLLERRSGTIGVGDYEAATAGLAETTIIHYWTGAQWETIGAPLTLNAAPFAGPGQTGRSATIPPLPEGDYRLVRAGPDGEHIGRFWIADRP